MKFFSQFDSSRAFTLIELLVVIAIVGILAGMVVVNMSGATDKARIAKLKVLSNSIRSSLLMNRVAEWKFDEGSGTSIADTVGSNTGDLTGHLPTWNTGGCISGSCLQFNGTVNTYADCGSSANLNFGTGDFSVEYWMYYTGTTAINNVANALGKSASMGSSPGWYSGITTYGGNGSNLKLLSSITNDAWGSGNLESGAYFSPNTWQHIILARSGTTLKHYRNGVLDGTRTIAGVGANVDNGLSFTIGRAAGSFINASMDEVRIYNVAVTLSQARENYLAGLDQLLVNGQITNQEYQQRLSDLNLTYGANK